MALVSYGAIITNMRGKQGGSIFTANPAGAVMRNKTIPYRRQTQAKSKRNTQWKLFTQSWRSLGASDISAWQTFATNFTFHNKLGAPVAARANIVFSTTNYFYYLQNVSILSTPATFTTPPIPGIASYSAIISAPQFILNFNPASADVYAYISASAPFTLGQQYKFQRRIPYMVNITATTGGTTFDLWPYYSAMFPFAQPGQYCWVAVRYVEQTCFAWSPFEYLLVKFS